MKSIMSLFWSSICVNIIRLLGSFTMCRNPTPGWKHTALRARRCRCWRSFFLMWLNSTNFLSLLPRHEAVGLSWLPNDTSRGPRDRTHAGGPGGASGCDGACDMILNNPTPWQPRQQCCRFDSGRESEVLAGGGSECVAEWVQQPASFLSFFWLVPASKASVWSRPFHTGSGVEA